MVKPTAISLFSGCGGDTLGLENAGYEVIAFSEFNKAAIQSHLRNFPNSTLLTGPAPAPTGAGQGSSDITKIPDTVFHSYAERADILFAGFPCFVKDTLVLTDTGYVPIQEVTLDHQLLTHTGAFKPIVNQQIKVYSDTLYDIKLKYHPTPISCTKEHPFYVRRRVDTWNTLTRRYDTSYDKPEWKEACKLDKDDYFGMPINTNDIIPEFSITKAINSSRTDIHTFSIDTNDQWFMMGYFLGDGWIEDTLKEDGRQMHKIRFAVNVKDIDTVVSRIQTVLPITDKGCDTGKCKKFGCADIAWWTVLKEFGKYAHGKRIPEWVQDAPKHFIQEFIAGYKAADGCTRKNGAASFTTVSPSLAFGLQRLYLKLGHIFTVHKTIRPSTCVIEGRTVNQRDTYNIRGKLVEPIYSSFIQDNYVWVASFKITTREVINETVYNFEVADDNSYCVENTIVHNCQGFSRAGKKRTNDPRNQLFQQFVRATRLVRPKLIIGENVTGLRSMKSGPNDDDPMMLDLIIQAFRDIGYTLTHQIVETVQFGVPQKRKRIVLVGWRGDSATQPEPASLWASIAAAGAAKPLPTQRTFITDSMEGAYRLPTLPEHFEDYALPIAQDAEPAGTPHPFVVLKANQNLLSCSKRDSPVHSEVIDIDAPSKTIICTYDHQPRLLVGLRKPDGTSYVRTLLPDELKQIQGFPATYQLLGNKKEVVTQIGNAVPPPLIECVATVLKNYI